MTFIDACGDIYKRELKKDFDKEISEDRYLPQSAFKNNRARAKGLQHAAQVAVDNFTALCILLHREKTTDEKYDEEKNELIVVMDTEDVITAEKYTWWRN